jgi:hypothetical protein
MSETYSEDLRFRLVDSRELVFVGCTLEDVVSSVFTLLFVEDLLLKAFRGAAKQLATATHGIFTRGARQRERKDFSPQISENTRFILFLCFTSFLYAFYSFMIYSPIMSFTFFSTSTMKSSAL